MIIGTRPGAASHLILVIGGTRGTGLLIAKLLDRGGRSVRVLARDPARAADRLGQRVHIVPGDITREETLPSALEAVTHIVFTAGCRSGRPVGEAQIKATEYHGVLNTLAAARRAGFSGRFLYMTSSGVLARSFWTVCLNLYKGNTLRWRRRAEHEIRASGLDYTIIRTGMLLNRPGGRRALVVSQDALPLSPRYRIARADVAATFAAALDHPRAVRTTFEVIWGRGKRQADWTALLGGLQPDAPGVDMTDANTAGHSEDPHDLSRFVQAQAEDYERALSEIRSGRKRSHWMWYIFPQLDGLGSSSMARMYAIKTVAEAEAYLRHPILGPRLRQITEAALQIQERSAAAIFGSTDELKLWSCATLFASVSPAGSVFELVLDKYFQGRRDSRTLELLEVAPPS